MIQFLESKSLLKIEGLFVVSIRTLVLSDLLEAVADLVESSDGGVDIVFDD